MSDSRARLVEALSVIKSDIEQRQAVEAEKKARTQYRDGFHFRRPAAQHLRPIQYWRQDDTSDDEYDPDAGKKRKARKGRASEHEEEIEKKKKKSSRRRKRPETSDDYDTERSVKRQKTHDEEADSPGAFTTLRLPSSKGRAFLAEKLNEHRVTDINFYLVAQQVADDEPSGWRAAGGGLHNVHKSMSEHERDYEYALAARDRDTQVREELLQPRQLRSGKVCADVVSKKRKRNSGGADTDAEETDADTDVERPEVTKFETSALSTSNAPAGSNDHDPQRSEGSEDGAPVEKSLSASLSRLSTNASPPEAHSAISTLTTDSFAGASETDPILIDSSDDDDDDDDEANKSSQTTITTASSARYGSTTKPTATAAAMTSSIINVRTHFSHPIDFKPTAGVPCTFHADYRHGIIGHGPTVCNYRVFSKRPSQLIAVDGDGDHDRGRGRDRADAMCTACAHAYLRTAHCRTHTFTRLSLDTNPALRDGGTPYVADLLCRSPRRSTVAPGIICSLCPVPALFRCVSLSSSSFPPPPLPFKSSLLKREQGDEERKEKKKKDKIVRDSGLADTTATTAATTTIDITISSDDSDDEDDNDKRELKGCGLNLCGECHTVVAVACRGDMQSTRHRDRIRAELRNRRVEPRADSDFHFRDGLVWKAYYHDKS